MSYISIFNTKPFGKIREVCNRLFHTNYKDCRGMGWFKPRTFKKLKLDKYKLWFPKIGHNKATGWENQLIKNETEIISKNSRKPGKAKPKQENITFAYIGNKYVFKGVFELISTNNGIERWKRNAKSITF